jgi:hypothetical protein
VRTRVNAGAQQKANEQTAHATGHEPDERKKETEKHGGGRSELAVEFGGYLASPLDRSPYHTLGALRHMPIGEHKLGDWSRPDENASFLE